MHTENRLLMLLTGACILLLTAGSFHAFADQASAENDHCAKKTLQNEESKSMTTESQILCNKHSLKYTAKSVALPDEAIEKLTINAGFGWGIFSGNIYNGNRHYSVTQLTISMTPIHDHHMEMMEMSSHEAKKYKIDLNLLPFSKGAISVAIANDDAHIHDFEWKIVQALGREITDLADSK
ncbi:MAG: hypothetical protein NMNS01_15750 [Nitrosomonas sp.]|nr:MAG: hypothetical protein NMNS01_15750 [Nitrosomonas sp.]